MIAAGVAAPTRLDDALAMARAGWLVVWVHSVDGAGSCSCGDSNCPERARGKHPIFSRWQKLSTSDETALCDQWRDRARARVPAPNIGIQGGPQSNGRWLVALDVDDAERLSTLEAEYGPLPATNMARSPRGERRFFYWPESVPTKGLKNVSAFGGGGPGVDVKMDRGQVVVIGRNAGGEYAGFDPSAPIADLPVAWADALRPKGRAAPSTTGPSDTAAERRAPVVDLFPRGGPGGRGKSASAMDRARAYLAKLDIAVQGEDGSGRIRRYACQLVRIVEREADQDALLEEWNLRCQPPWSPKELAHAMSRARRDETYEGLPDRPRAKSSPGDDIGAGGSQSSLSSPRPPSADDARDWDDENPGHAMPKLLEDNGSPCRNAGNVARMLAIYPRGVPRYNTLSYRVEWPDGSEVTDGDESRVQDWLLAQEHAYRVRASLETVHQGILDAAEARPFQPVRDYLESLVWDGVPRAQAFGATYLGAAPGAYTESVTRCMLNGAVARAFDPGCQHDTVVVLEGRQGARKTSAIRALFGGKYFSNTRINFHKSPDCYQANDGVWCRELAEFDGYTRGADVAVVKDYVSSREDRYRPSYARNLVTRRRQCVFIGTTNASQYLHDETGSRRYLGLPVGVAGAIDTEAILRDRDQIWAEVVAWYRAGIPWWLDATMEAAAADQAEERYSGDTWEERLPGLLEGRPTCTAAEALELLGVELSRQGRAEQMRVGAALRRIGWVRRRTMKFSVRTYEYVRAVNCPI